MQSHPDYSISYCLKYGRGKYKEKDFHLLSCSQGVRERAIKIGQSPVSRGSTRMSFVDG
ncbi:hypothetical protein GCM10011507_02480 [Edaphobacter acidisoli]|uniref:Uncharacterized protein n=1 Tax=Edaphobacter acidisoli TaxID=2040573 RepID=A0A916VZS8_9BACT|nr:hypothetical protein GCM10011507_02480 [Edaphobacter acidisoli]